ncbi:MAG: hypothetical protein SF051_04415 [Elusimicrobiota bacterium]|nr:hypothetical protein [Elusimicrobiota bacterium]
MFTPKRARQIRKYKNLSGDSKVVTYEFAKDGVTVAFKDNSVYRYTNQSSSPADIAKMKTLAAAGKGLGTFIASSMKGRHLRRVR